jgi:hypothetical protein
MECRPGKRSDCYCEQERVELMLTEAMLTGHVNDSVQAELASRFSRTSVSSSWPPQASYAMVPRALGALRVPIEEDPPATPSADHST